MYSNRIAAAERNVSRDQPSFALRAADQAGVGLSHLSVWPSSSPAIPITTCLQQPLVRPSKNKLAKGEQLHVHGRVRLRIVRSHHLLPEDRITSLEVVQMPREKQVHVVLPQQRLDQRRLVLRAVDFAVKVVIRAAVCSERQVSQTNDHAGKRRLGLHSGLWPYTTTHGVTRRLTAAKSARMKGICCWRSCSVE